MSAHYRPWRDAWARAAYGEGGFWQRALAEDHFRTAATSTALFADAISRLLCDHRHIVSVIEIGSGNGRLLSDLAASRPELALTGVDRRARPDGLPERVGWRCDLWDVAADGWTTGSAADLFNSIDRPTLVLAVEWLDDLPCTVAGRADGQLREVEVDNTGAERHGQLLHPAESAWCAQWWPDGGRVEGGRTRDRAWAAALEPLRRCGGLGMVVDFGHVRSNRPRHGTLAAYHQGQQLRPQPSRDVNLTAAVAIDSLAAAGEQVGAVTVSCERQSETLTRLLGAAAAPADTLAALVTRSERAALLSPRLWGDQWWLVQQVPAPAVVD